MIEAITSFDTQILATLYAVRDPLALQIFIWITELGSTLTIGGLAACVALALVLRGRFEYLAGLVVSVAGSAATMLVLKEIIARPRPPVSFQAYVETGFSFPSGHAALSLALYGFLAYMAWRTISSKSWRAASVFIAASFVAAIGFSRLYLGVHYASDVLASFIIATFFVWIGTVVTIQLEKRLRSQ